jgi:hypothetical protein
MVGHIHPAERRIVRETIALHDALGHPSLGLPKPAKDPYPGKVVHETRPRDPGPRGDSLLAESIHGRQQDGSSVRSYDPVGPSGIRVLREPRGDGPRRADVPEGPRDGAAGRDAPSRDLTGDHLEGAPEFVFHGSAIVVLTQNLSRVVSIEGPPCPSYCGTASS